MKKIIISTCLILIFQTLNAITYTNCRIIMNDDTEKIGKAMMPYMLNKKILFISQNAEHITLFSKDLKAIEFDDEGTIRRFEQVLTYKNEKNTKINKNKTWLEVKRTGYVTLYYGFQPGLNTPNGNYWYCLKKDESIAYYITMKYSGGPVITIGTGNLFIKNTSIYFSDYEKLVDKIKSKKLTLDNLTTIVDLYNNWKKRQ